MKGFMTVKVSSTLAKKKLANEFAARGISEEEYLSRSKGSAFFKIPKDMCDMLRTDSDFQEGVDFKVMGSTRRPARKPPAKPRPTLKQMVARGLVEPARRNLRTPTA